jgi:hypothetical protein
MLYVQQSLGADEEIVHIGQFHWMYTLNAVLSIFWGLVACILIIWGGLYFKSHFGPVPYEDHGLLSDIRSLHPAVRLGAFFAFILGLLRFAQMMVIKATTEIAVTTSRLIYKRGLVARYVGEMSIDRIEGVNVLQTIFGRMFGYGRLMVRGMGVGEVVLPPLANPIAFRKAIERARTA